MTKIEKKKYGLFSAMRRSGVKDYYVVRGPDGRIIGSADSMETAKSLSRDYKKKRIW